MKPQLKVPAIPHPAPFHRVAVLASKEGLLLCPYAPGITTPNKYVRVPWGVVAEIQEVDGHAEPPKDIDWSDAAVVYGILGIVKLFNGTQTRLFC